jgi:hypothetical protein
MLSGSRREDCRLNVLRDESVSFAGSGTAVDRHQDAFVTIESPAADPHAAARIIDRLRTLPCAQLLVFAAPSVDMADLMARLGRGLPGTPVAGCSTAGEIGAAGYADDRIVAVALPARHFASETVVLRDLSAAGPQALAERVSAARLVQAAANPDKPAGFAFLMVDGLSLREDVLVGALEPALGDMRLFGGSAGDGRIFGRTLVASGGEVLSDAAILTLVRTDHDVKVFSLDNLEPTEQRMVVTAADPDLRIVREINAEPAAREYARIVGEDPDRLDTFTFASRPVTVRLGGSHHVRAIQRVTEGGDLVFFSAIEEGMVLTVARAADMVTHLETSLSRLTRDGAAIGILACDCILRRIAAEQAGQAAAVSALLSRFGVVGFSTYGEQVGPLHLNQTMTGVALFRSDGTRTGTDRG